MIKIGDREITSIEAAMDKQIWDGIHRFATTRVNAKMLPPGVKDVDQVIAVVLAGIDLGFPLGTSLDNLQVIQNKISPPAQAMWALAVRHAKATPEIIASTDEYAEVALSSDSRARMVFRYTMDMAKKAGLSGDNWKKYPAQMLLARAKSVLVRNFAPEVVGGLYSQEELDGGNPTFDLNEIVGEPETVAAAKPAPRAAAPKAAPKPAAPKAQAAAQGAAPAPVSVPAAAPAAVSAVTENAVAAKAAIMDALPGRVREEKVTEILSGKHVQPVIGALGEVDKGKTAPLLLKAMQEHVYGGDQAQALTALKAKTAELGAAKSTDLGVLEFTSLFRWVDAQVDDALAAAATPAIADFNPARGTGTQPGSNVEDGVAVNLDDAIAAAWGTLAQLGRQDEANAAMEDSTYNAALEESSNTVKQDTLTRLQSLLAA